MLMPWESYPVAPWLKSNPDRREEDQSCNDAIGGTRAICNEILLKI